MAGADPVAVFLQRRIHLCRGQFGQPRLALGHRLLRRRQAVAQRSGAADRSCGGG